MDNIQSSSMYKPQSHNPTVSELVEYIRQGEQHQVISILLQQPNIRKQKNFVSVVKAAVETKSETILTWLVENASDKQKNAALEMSVNSGIENVIDMALKQGANVDEGLYYAVKLNKIDVIKVLIDRGANVNYIRNGYTLLHTSITKNCKLQIIKFLIDNVEDVDAIAKNKSALNLVQNAIKESNNAKQKEKLEEIISLIVKKKQNNNVIFECLTGLPDGLHGYSYQIKFLTLYAIVNTKSNIKYELGTEVSNLLPFDDIYLKRTQDGQTNCEFVQVKQTKKPEVNKIKESNFFTILKSGQNDVKEHLKGNDTIVKMLIKFDEIFSRCLQNGASGEFIYCTNTTFDHPPSCLFVRRDKDDLLCGVGGQKWQISDCRYLEIEIKYILLNIIAFTEYIKIMGDEMKTNITLQINLIKELKLDHLFSVRNEQYLWSLDKIAQEGLRGIEKYLRVLEDSKKNIKKVNSDISVKEHFPNELEVPKNTGNLEDFKNRCISKIDEFYKSIKHDKEMWVYFCKWDTSSKYIKTLEDFVRHFSVYTDCPNADKLENIITQELVEEFKFHELNKTDYCLNFFYKWVSRFKNKQGNYFTNKDGEHLFNYLEEQTFNTFNKEYLEPLQKYNIQFQCVDNDLLSFLDNENNKILHVITEHPQLHAIKIFQSLKNLHSDALNSKYIDSAMFTSTDIIFKSDVLVKSILKLFSSNLGNNIMFVETSHDVKFHSLQCESLFSILNKWREVLYTNKRKKIVIIGKRDNQIAVPLQFMFLPGSEFVSYEKAVSLMDLNAESQQYILEKTINFQNNPESSSTNIKISNFLTASVACDIIDEGVLAMIITNRDSIKIGNSKAFKSDEYNPQYYIQRHIEGSENSSPDNINQKIVILSNNAGVGKSTMLTDLACTIKKKFSMYWIVRVNLNDYTNNKLSVSLKDVNFTQEDTVQAAEFTSLMVIQDTGSNRHNVIERKLFKHALVEGSNVEVVLLFDGFDEIVPSYKEQTCILIRALAKSKVKQIWITTRVHMKKYLEEQFQVSAYTLAPFSEKDQLQFLNRFWGWNLKNYKDSQEETSEEYIKLGILDQIKALYDIIRYKRGITVIEQLKKYGSIFDVKRYIDTHLVSTGYANRFLDQCQQYKYTNHRFLREPLHLEMLAKNVFHSKWKNFLMFEVNIHEIYAEFIDYQINIIYNQFKSKTERGNQAIKDQVSVSSVVFREMHREVAVRTLLQAFANLPDIQICSKYNNISCEGLPRLGLVKPYEDNFEFVHRCYAEYFCAEYVAEHLKNPVVQTKFFQEILLNSEWSLMRYFLNGFLQKLYRSGNSDENYYRPNVSNQYTNVILPSVLEELVASQSEGDNVLHVAAREGCTDIYLLLLYNIKSSDYINLILQDSKKGYSVMLLAMRARCGELLQIIMDSVYKEPDVKEQLFKKLTIDDRDPPRYKLTSRKNGQVSVEFFYVY